MQICLLLCLKFSVIRSLKILKILCLYCFIFQILFYFPSEYRIKSKLLSLKHKIKGPRFFFSNLISCISECDYSTLPLHQTEQFIFGLSVIYCQSLSIFSKLYWGSSFSVKFS